MFGTSIRLAHRPILAISCITDSRLLLQMSLGSEFVLPFLWPNLPPNLRPKLWALWPRASECQTAVTRLSDQCGRPIFH